MSDRKRSLHEINVEIERIALEGVDVPDDSEDAPDEDYFVKQLGELQMERDQKIQNIGYVRLEQRQKLSALSAEIKRLSEWKKRIEKRAESLERYCLMEMDRAGIKKVEGEFVTVSTRNKSVYTRLTGEPVDKRFIREEVVEKPMRKEALDHYKLTGEDVDGMEFIEGDKSLIIR